MKFVKRAIPLLLVVAAFNARAAEKSGALTGTIVSRDAATNRLTVAHGEVSGVMGAMTMPYEVRGQKVASLPKDGAKVTAMLHESDGAYWLTNVAAAGEQPAMPAMEHEHAAMPQHGATSGMHMQNDATSELLMRQASGTSMNAAAAPMHMTMSQHGDWMLMLHGLAFVNQVVQSGPRGHDKFFSTNWIMGMADRSLGGGHLMLRTMLSLEPLTVGKKYPELFQTGETIGGGAVVDAQHPHDFFMGVGAEKAHPHGGGRNGQLFPAPVR